MTWANGDVDWISVVGLLACFGIIVILVMPNCTPGVKEDDDEE